MNSREKLSIREPYQALDIKVSFFQTTQPSYQKLSINVKHEAEALDDVQSFSVEDFKTGYYSKQCCSESVNALKNLYLTFPVDYLLPCAKFIPPTKGFSMDGYYTTNMMYTRKSKQPDISNTALHSTFQVVE